MTKSFTAMAILKLRDEASCLDDPAEKYVPELKARLSDMDSRAYRSGIFDPLRGFPEDNPGDQQLAARRTDSAMSGLYFRLPMPRHRLRVFNFVLPSSAHRCARVRQAISGLYLREHPATLGMKATTLDPKTVPSIACTRYRWRQHMREEPPLPTALLARWRYATSVRDLSRYVAFLISAWPQGTGPKAARFVGRRARNAAAVAHGGATVTRQSRRAAPAEAGGMVWPAYLAELRFPAPGGAQRGLPASARICAGCPNTAWA